VVEKGPPVAAGAAQNGDGTVTVSGVGFGPDSRVFFDGAQASSTVFSGSEQQGSLTVQPPPGAPGQLADITVYNSDGQNSTLIPGSPKPSFTYAAGSAPQILGVAPNAVAAGTTAMVDISVANMNLVDGQVTVGFGSDDVQVRRVWVVGASRLLVNVSVTANASLGLSQVSVISGMQVALAPNAFQTVPANSGVPAIFSVLNAIDPTQPLLPGGFATIFGQNLGNAQVSVNDVPVQVIFSGAGQVNVVLPAGIPAGPMVLRLIAGGASAVPVAIQIDGRLPVINAVNSNGTPAAGDGLQVIVTGLDSSLLLTPQRLRVTISGIEMGVQQIAQAVPGTYIVQVAVTQSFGGAQVPLVVWADGTASAPTTVTIR
jgi:uncharacterized protein (TIGR03437 family)